MSPEPLPATLAGEIEQLRCGTVFLTVPLRHGAIQVGSTGPLPTAMIEVRKSRRDLVVRRTDGAELQAQVIRRSDGGEAVRQPVFTEPVPALVIQRIPQPDGTHQWLTSGCRTAHSSDLVQLITTIVAFGVAKQRRTTYPSRLRESA